jgi:hypothetical protein
MTDSIWDEDPSESTTSDIVVAQERNPDDEVASLIQNDANGNEVVTEINFSSPELDEQSARAITESIKTTANMMYLLVKRAHAGFRVHLLQRVRRNRVWLL